MLRIIKALPLIPAGGPPEDITLDKWHQPLSQPSFARVKAAAAIAVVAGATFVPQPPIVAAAVPDFGWFGQLSQPIAPTIEVAAVTAPFVATSAPAVAETVTLDKWHQPLSPRPAPAGRVNVATGLAPFVALPVQPGTSVDKWHMPLSPRPPPKARANVATGPATFVSLTIPSPDKWHRPLAEPIRPPAYKVVAADQTFDSATVGPDDWLRPLSVPLPRPRPQQPPALTFVYAPPAAALANFGWFGAFSQPQWPTIEVVATAAPFVATGAGPTAPDLGHIGWHQPLATPVRFPAYRVFEVDQGYTAAVVSPDEWLRPLSEPAKRPTLHVSRQQFLAFVYAPPAAPALANFGWFAEFSQPLRPTVEVAAVIAPFVATGAGPTTPAGPDLGHIGWHQALSQPVRLPAYRIIEIDQGYTAAIVSPDEWLKPLSEPVRRPALHVSRQPALFFVPVAVAPVETVTLDKWHRALEQPTRRPQPRQAAGHTGVVAPPVSPSFAWHQALSRPIWPPAYRVIAADQTFDSATVGPDEWFQPLSLPVRRAAQPNQATGPTWVWTPPAAPETVTLDKWFNPLWQPKRFLPGLSTQFQQALVWSPQPIVRPPLPDFGWWVDLARPTLPRVQPTPTIHWWFVGEPSDTPPPEPEPPPDLADHEPPDNLGAGTWETEHSIRSKARRKPYKWDEFRPVRRMIREAVKEASQGHVATSEETLEAARASANRILAANPALEVFGTVQDLMSELDQAIEMAEQRRQRGLIAAAKRAADAAAQYESEMQDEDDAIVAILMAHHNRRD